MMRTVSLPEISLSTRWSYALLVEDIDVDGFRCESYGVMVTDLTTGEREQVRHVTVNAAQAATLIATLARCAVSPITLRDVVEDWLAEHT